MKLLAILLTVVLFFAKIVAGVTLSWFVVFLPIIALACWVLVVLVVILVTPAAVAASS